MARSARSHRNKVNKSVLRSKLFGPVETARSERMSQRLMEIVSQPKSEPQTEKMEVEPVANTSQNITSEKGEYDVGDDMELDRDTTGHRIVRKKSLHKTPSRVQKKRRGKPHAQIVFPGVQRRKQKMSANKNRKWKQPS